MRMLRKEVRVFVESWNNHKIRKQRNRPNSVSGRPWFLYEHPEPMMDYKQPVNADMLAVVGRSVEEFGLSRPSFENNLMVT